MTATFVKLAFAFQKPMQFIKYVVGGGRSLSSFSITARLKEYSRNFQTIIDVGANTGQFAIAAHYHYPDAKIYSFEPEPDTFRTLQENTGSIQNLRLENLALGDTNGALKFYKNRYSLASSALAVHENQVQFFPGTARTTEISVTGVTLDQYMKGVEVEGPVLLKIDTQGYEKNVLLGGKEFLASVQAVVLEASFISMYKNEPLFHELHALLISFGFQLVAPLDFLQTNDMRILQMDVLYSR